MTERDHLTIGEWNRFREDDREFKERVLDSLDSLTKDSAERNTEIATLRAGNARSIQKMSGLSALVSAVVSGVIGALKS